MLSRKRSCLTAIFCSLVLVVQGSAPISARTARLEAVARMLVQNAEDLARYDWKFRTEIRVAGEIVQNSLVRVTHDELGFTVETPLPGVPGASSGSKKMKKKVVAFYEKLQALTRSYIELDPQQIQAALARAHAWEGQGEQGDLLHVQARGVIRQADKLDLWIENTTNQPHLLEVLTSLQGEPVRLTTKFAQLEEGPSYAAETLVETELKEKKMVVRTESFGHVVQDD